MQITILPSSDMSDEELDANLVMIIRAHCDRGTKAVRTMINEQFPDVSEKRLKASTARIAQKGFVVNDAEWRRYLTGRT